MVAAWAAAIGAGLAEPTLQSPWAGVFLMGARCPWASWETCCRASLTGAALFFPGAQSAPTLLPQAGRAFDNPPYVLARQSVPARAGGDIRPDYRMTCPATLNRRAVRGFLLPCTGRPVLTFLPLP